MYPIFSFIHSQEEILAQAAPTINGAFVLSVVLRVLHIFSAIVLVGGIFYQRTVLYGTGEKGGTEEQRTVWSRWVSAATFLLIATGLYNFFSIRHTAEAAGNPLPATYHALFGIKFLLALVVMFLAAILAGKTATAEKFRQNMPKWLNLAWMASLAIIVLAAMLRALHQ